MNKRTALEILEGLRSRSGWLLNSLAVPEITQWIAEVEDAIRNLFRGEEDRLSRFRAIIAGWEEEASNGTLAEERMLKANAFLDAMIKTVQQYWPDDEPAPIAQLGKAASAMIETPPTADPRSVFVVHGRNNAVRKAMFDFLRAIGLAPLEWSQVVAATGKSAPYVGEILDKGFSMAKAVVVLLTPDDEARLREDYLKPGDPAYEAQLTGQARPNVLFEAGMALGLHPVRTVLVEIGKLRPFTDVLGRHVVKLDNSSQRRQDLAERLRTAGCAVDLSGRDWHTVGAFDLTERQSLKPTPGGAVTAADKSCSKPSIEITNLMPEATYEPEEPGS